MSMFPSVLISLAKATVLLPLFLSSSARYPTSVIKECRQMHCWHMQGTLPESWGNSGAFPLLRFLTLNFNFRLTGSLPATWGSNSNSLGKLEVLTMRDCNLTGTLPASWASNMASLSVLDLSNNWLSGMFGSQRSAAHVFVSNASTAMVHLWWRAMPVGEGLVCKSHKMLMSL